MAKVAKYTDAMVAIIREVSEAHSGLDLALCASIAERDEFVAADISARGIVAKARTMGLPYRKVEKTSKTGEPVARKDELVAVIEKALGVTGLDSLAKAEKPALRKLVNALVEASKAAA